MPLDLATDWPSLAVQMGGSLIAAYMGVAARMVRVEEKIKALEGTAGENRTRIGDVEHAARKADERIGRHVEIFHTNNRIREGRKWDPSITNP